MTTATEALAAAVQRELARNNQSASSQKRPDLAAVVQQIAANLKAARVKAAQESSRAQRTAVNKGVNSEWRTTLEAQVAKRRADAGL